MIGKLSLSSAIVLFSFAIVFLTSIAFKLSAQTQQPPAKSTTASAPAPAVIAEPAKVVKIPSTKKDELSRKLELRREELRQDGRCKKKEEKPPAK